MGCLQSVGRQVGGQRNPSIISGLDEETQDMGCSNVPFVMPQLLKEGKLGMRM